MGPYGRRRFLPGPASPWLDVVAVACFLLPRVSLCHCFCSFVGVRVCLCVCADCVLRSMEQKGEPLMFHALCQRGRATRFEHGDEHGE